MLDLLLPSRPRVVLVYGDAGHVGHLRDALASQVEIVYETAAAEFDAARLTDSQATAALVNLDACDWLDSVEARLNEAGIAVVFNDPEISCNLEGWAQARWLRHLTAKLRGSTDFDPPRPAVAAAVHAAATASTSVGPDPALPALPVEDALAITERPLSPTEIASMTANFIAVQEPSGVAASLDDMSGTEPDGAGIPRAGGDAGEAAAGVGMNGTVASPAFAAAMTDDAPPRVVPTGREGEDSGVLDVDTEALSAMIDARLAESAAQTPNGSPEVWRVVEGESVSAAELTPADTTRGPVADEPAADGQARTPSPPVDDSDVLDGLPALGDWQLVDPDAPITPAAGPKPGARIEPTLRIDFGDLELVPIETVAPVAHARVEPTDSWMQVGSGKVAADKRKRPAVPSADGEHA